MMNRCGDHSMMNRAEQTCESSLYRSLFALLYMGAVGVVATTDSMNGQERGLRLEETTWEKLQGEARAEHRTIHLVLHRGNSPLYEFLRREVVGHKEFARFFGEYFANGAIDITAEEGERTKRLLGLEPDDDGGEECLHLFIAPNGRLLHRVAAQRGSVRRSVARLLNAGLHALESDRQYYTLRERYRAGDKGDDLLLRYLIAAREAEAPEAPRIAEEYVAVRVAMSGERFSAIDILRPLGLAPLGVVLQRQIESTARAITEGSLQRARRDQ